MSATTYPAASTMESEHTVTVPAATSGTTPSATTAHVAAPPAHGSARTVVAPVRSALAEGRSYYGSGRARIRLLVISGALTYGGGAAMFWLHAIVRGEQGPAISNLWHWLLDSTLGLLGLTPVLVVLLPLTAKVLSNRTTAYAAVGAAFALVTAPGPILHNSSPDPAPPWRRPRPRSSAPTPASPPPRPTPTPATSTPHPPPSAA